MNLNDSTVCNSVTKNYFERFLYNLTSISVLLEAGPSKQLVTLHLHRPIISSSKRHETRFTPWKGKSSFVSTIFFLQEAWRILIHTLIILSGNCLLVLLLKIFIWLYNLNLIFIKCFSWIFIKCVSRGYENDVAALYMTASTDTSCVLLCFSWLKCWSTSWLSTSRKWDTSPNRFWRNNWHFLFLHSISLHAIKFFLSCRNTLFHVIEC